MKCSSFLIFLLCLLFRPLPVTSKATTPPPKEQQPLISDSAPYRPENEPGDYSSWKLNFSSEAPHYFASVYGLLQQLPNTFFPNGHVIAAGEIPPFTKLYHGWFADALPESPEWLAFDIEMSYGIMGWTSNSFMLTYQTTRAVQVLYFDGESAALQGYGQLDSQMLHIFGNVTGPPKKHHLDGFGEYMRAAGLCDWLSDKKLGGVGWGFEGIVRMNAGFELIWCNFSSPSLRLISRLNVSTPELAYPSWNSHSNEASRDTFDYRAKNTEIVPFPLPPISTTTSEATDPTDPPEPPIRLPKHHPFFRSRAWVWLRSAIRHYGSSGLGPRVGENRVKIYPQGILNYYSPEFQSQGFARAESELKRLNLTKEGFWLGPKENDANHRAKALKDLMRRRRHHRLDKVDRQDADVMRENTERVLSNIVKGDQMPHSGAEWHMIMNEIVQTYAVALMRVQLHLKSGSHLKTANYTAVRDWMFILRVESHAFYMPFLQYPADPTDHQQWRAGSNITNEAIALCKYHHTRLLVPGEGIPLCREEDLLRRAVEEIMGAICYVTQEIGFAVEDVWFTYLNEDTDSQSPPWDERKMRADIRRWTNGMEELMAWLGWAGEWVRCEKICAWDEECYIPMWPLMFMMWRHWTADHHPLRGYPREHKKRGGSYHPLEGTETEWEYLSKKYTMEMDREDDLWEPKCIKEEYLPWK